MTPEQAKAAIEERKKWHLQNCKDLCEEKNLDYDMVLKMVTRLSCIVPSNQCSACFSTIFDILDMLPKPMIVTPFPIGGPRHEPKPISRKQKELMDKFVEDLKAGRIELREK